MQVKKKIKSLKIKLKKIEKDLERVREYKNLEKNLMEDHLDLEGIAQHRSSLFGAINKTPRNQKNL